MKISLLIGLFFVCFVVASRDPITSLPGIDPSNWPSYEQYSGYIGIAGGKNLFYWFVESQNDPFNDPILLWMQGGPGCSGLLGFWTENGPFQLQSDESIKENIYSWNRLANVIYLEQPAGVGYSYADHSTGYQTNDNQTAIDNYEFLQGWFNEFPEYKTNQFWLTGESYAGVYIPTLANQILTGPDTSLKDSFEGFMLGNPVIHCPLWVKESQTIVINNWYFHGLVSYANRASWYNQKCHITVTSSCNDLYNSMKTAIGPHSGDNLYKNFCTGNATLDFTASVPPGNCRSLDILVENYLNRADVQLSIHANPPALGAKWKYCDPLLPYTQLGQNMLDYYNEFFDLAVSERLRILVYNGDIDISTVPHPYTQLCLSALERTVIQSWAPWTVLGPVLPLSNGVQSNITAGYQEIYDGYSFATVKGAGHEVPTFQPYFAYQMMERFIVNQEKL